VDYNLKILEERGVIERQADVSRGIRLLGRDSGQEGQIAVPVIGMIAAGQPIPVPNTESWDVAAVSDTMEVPRELVAGKKGVYALKVKGQSMIDALIDEGIVPSKCCFRGNGEMAAVWLRETRKPPSKRSIKRANESGSTGQLHHAALLRDAEDVLNPGASSASSGRWVE
jgi:repressor LexA